MEETHEERLARLRAKADRLRSEGKIQPAVTVPEPTPQQRDVPQLPGAEDPQHRLENSLRLGAEKNPQQAAEADRLAREHGVPAPAVEENLEAARAKSRLNQVDKVNILYGVCNVISVDQDTVHRLQVIFSELVEITLNIPFDFWNSSEDIKVPPDSLLRLPDNYCLI